MGLFTSLPDSLAEVSIKSNNVKDLIRRLYKDPKLVAFLEFKDLEMP
jgi:hypothetical protein